MKRGIVLGMAVGAFIASFLMGMLFDDKDQG